MHIVDRFQLPNGYVARPYRGRADHPAMAAILTAHRQHQGEPEMVSAEQIDGNYSHLVGCDPWRNRGIAGTLLAWSLRELRDRGMTEAAHGVDTNNPGGAFQLYRSLGFEPVSYGAVYVRDVGGETGGQDAA